MPARPRKCISTYDELETCLWHKAEQNVRETYDAPDAREGEILGQIAAEHLGKRGPLDSDTQ